MRVMFVGNLAGVIDGYVEVLLNSVDCDVLVVGSSLSAITLASGFCPDVVVIFNCFHGEVVELLCDHFSLVCPESLVVGGFVCG